MFDIQDPRYPNSRLLHEALLEACQPALYGAGTYAFVSADGVRLLMDNLIFEEFMKIGAYHLIVGMDDITDLRTLAALKEYGERFPHMEARALIHPTAGSTYHPKYSWFRYEEGGVLVLGSGNLTAKGLRRNTEAFMVQRLDEESMRAVEWKWADWLSSSRPYLKALSDPAVIHRAAENGKRAAKKVLAARNIEDPVQEGEEWEERTEQPSVKTESLIVSDQWNGESARQGQRCGKEAKAARVRDSLDWNPEQESWTFDRNSPVLVAELSPGDPWGLSAYQLHVDIPMGNSFFGADFRPLKSMVWREVTSGGHMGTIQWEPIQFNDQRQYEMSFALYGSGENPAAKGRPFAVFVKLAPRTFLYTVISPGKRGYKQLVRKSNRAPRNEEGLVLYITTGAQLKEQLNALAVLNYLV